MFRTNKRQLLYIPINDEPTFHYVAPKADEPRLVVQYITPAERDRIIARHTVKKFYPRPMTDNDMLHIAQQCWSLPIVQARAKEVCDSINVDIQMVGNVWQAIMRDLPKSIPTEAFIERNERNDTEVLIELCQKAIVGWENVRDEEDGKLILFTPDVLSTLLNEGGEFTIWCMNHIPIAMRRFDELVREQRLQSEKNSEGLSISTTPDTI